MRKVLVLVVLAAVLLVGVWLFVGGPQPAPGVKAGARERSPVTVQVERASDAGRRVSDERARMLREQGAERAALRRQITDLMQARAAAAPGLRVPVEDDGSARARREAPGDAKAVEGTPNPMIDRTGNHAYLARVMSQDLMPLADECYELVRAHKPELAGMLVLDVEILSDEEIGGVVDSVEPGANNELVDRELIECVRESLLATTLPKPEQGGKDAISLSMRFSPAEKQ